MTHQPRPALIETMLVAEDGTLPLLPDHLDRLRQSAGDLNYPLPHDLPETLRLAAMACAGVGAHRMRLLLHRDGKIDLTTAPLAPLGSVEAVCWSALRLNGDEPWLRHKSTHRPWYDAATRWLADHTGAFDLLFVNEAGNVCEGSRSNVYVLVDGVWLTPPVEDGCLPGVARAALLRSGAARCATLSVADVKAAQGLRVSNALRGWIDVRLDDVIVTL